jgi:hypothetical protein
MATATSIVETDLPCVGCQYNLRTQPLDGLCPECGKPIRATLQFPHLRRSAPRWLTSLVDSVTVLLTAFGFAVACYWTNRGRDDPLPVLLGTAAWALAWFAVWLLTRPEPGRNSRAGRAAAWMLRVCTTLPYLGVFGAPQLIESFVRNDLELWGTLIAAALMVFVLPATFLYYDHLCDAAYRLANRHLAWQAAAMCWLLPPAVLVSISGIVVLDRLPGSQSGLLTTLPMVGLGGIHDVWTFAGILRARGTLIDPLPLTVGPAAVMTLWAVAVLVQFRFAFAAAVREAGGR